MDEVASSGVPLCQRDVHLIRINAIEAAESFVVGAENDFVRPRLVHPDAVIGERPLVVKVEHKHVIIALEADYLVALVTPVDVTRVAVQPAVLLLASVHRAIEFVQEFVLQRLVI